MLSKDEFRAYIDVRTTKKLIVTLFRFGIINEKDIKIAWHHLDHHSFKYSSMRYDWEEPWFSRTSSKENGR